MNLIVEEDLLKILEKVEIGKFRNKSILVTGSNGLIGTYIIMALYLANKNHNLNIKVIGISKNEPNDLLSEIKENKNIILYKKNLVNDFEFNEKVDYIIHAATYAQPIKFLENKLETIKLNTVVTEKLLDICKKNNASFLFMSSSEIYGQAEKIPTPETYNGNCSTTYDRAPYTESKRLGETICSIFKGFGMDVKIARGSSIYGPGISIYDKRVLGNFLNKALIKKSIDLLDSGKQERAWLYVGDCIVMLFNILLHGKSLVYNVGGEEMVSIRKLAEVICELTDSEYSLPEKIDSVFMAGAPNKVGLDISKVKNEFKLDNFVDLKEGIRRTIEWNKEFIKKNNIK
ncbi:MAG: NAD-dependent epimerase/dehydratase family protein [Nanoarchaeota archaeon]|nr:NAD-dependent epimerase/dehydratase family protein [Nanoarchaeota archaeon]